MRVLFWSDLFWPYIGGSEIFAAKLLLALRNRHEFVVVTRQDSPDLPSEDSYSGVPVYRFPFCTALASRDVTRMIALRRQVAALKRNFAPDLIHIHNFGPSILFHLETADVSPAPSLFTATLEILPGADTGPDTLLRGTLRAADWVTGVSSDTLAQVRARRRPSLAHLSFSTAWICRGSCRDPFPPGQPDFCAWAGFTPKKGSISHYRRWPQLSIVFRMSA